MGKSLKKERGITLIALVITIVVMLILAVVTINLTLGNNGIFQRAKTAKEQYQNAEDYEKSKIKLITNDIDSFITNGQVNAEDIEYTNPNWPGITNVKQALDYLYNN